MTGNQYQHGRAWRKSTFSSDKECVEIGHGPAGIAVRDSKNPGGPVLAGSLQIQMMLHLVASGRIG